MEAILAVVEAEEIEDLQKSSLLPDVLAILMEQCCAVDPDSLDGWEDADNNEDDTEETVSAALERLGRLMTKTEKAAEEDDDEENAQLLAMMGQDAPKNALEEDREPILLPVFFEKLQAFAGNNKWELQVARLLMLQTVLGFVRDHSMLKEIFHQAATIVLDVSGPKNGRLRFAAWCVLCELCTAHRRFCVEDDAERLKWMDLLTRGLQIETELHGSPRVLVRVLDCIVYYLADDDCLEPEDVESNLQLILQTTVKVIEGAHAKFSNRGICSGASDEPADTNVTHANLTPEMRTYLAMQVQAVSTLSALISVAGISHFAPFYKDIMLLMQKLLGAHMRSSDSRELLGAAIECASSLGGAVERDVFLADAQPIAEAMVTVVQNAKMADDPVKDYAFQAAQKLASVG